jgi:hypothetical protein
MQLELNKTLLASLFGTRDVFSKDDEVESEVLLDLINDLFQDDRLLVLLNLASPVDDIFFTTSFEILPSVAPTSSPSIQDDGSPSQEACDAIANGNPVSGQEAQAHLSKSTIS